MQRGNLIVKRLALLVETAHAARDHFSDQLIRNDLFAMLFRGEVRGHFQQIQRAARIAIGRLRQQHTRLG